MSNYFSHKRAKTFEQGPRDIQSNPEKQWDCLYTTSYKNQIQNNYFSEENILSKIQQIQHPTGSKLRGSLVDTCKYSRFPREADFLLKTRKDQQLRCFPNSKLPQQFQQNKMDSGLKKKARKIDSPNLFFSDQLPDRKPNSDNLKTPLRIPSFLQNKKAKPKKDPSCLLGKSSLESEEGHFFIGSIKLKETRSTLNLNTTSISEVSKKVEDQADCLDLSFEMQELLNRSIDEKMANDKEAAEGAIRELQLLLDY